MFMSLFSFLQCHNPAPRPWQIWKLDTMDNVKFKVFILTATKKKNCKCALCQSVYSSAGCGGSTWTPRFSETSMDVKLRVSSLTASPPGVTVALPSPPTAMPIRENCSSHHQDKAAIHGGPSTPSGEESQQDHQRPQSPQPQTVLPAAVWHTVLL